MVFPNVFDDSNMDVGTAISILLRIIFRWKSDWRLIDNRNLDCRTEQRCRIFVIRNFPYFVCISARNHICYFLLVHDAMAFLAIIFSSILCLDFILNSKSIIVTWSKFRSIPKSSFTLHMALWSLVSFFLSESKNDHVNDKIIIHAP